jgi:hypothetical protein
MVQVRMPIQSNRGTTRYSWPGKIPDFLATGPPGRYPDRSGTNIRLWLRKGMRPIPLAGTSRNCSRWRCPGPGKR